MRADGLTDAEGVIADHLFAAMQAFLELPVEHPYDQDEFTMSVHTCQGLLAERIVRRLYPVGWPRVEADNPDSQASG